MKIVTVVGARPQFVKAAVVSRELTTRPDVQEVIVHTGQHYDQRMSQVFFDELSIPRPAYNLQIGSGTHGRQTGKMLSELEDVLEREQPSAVLVYGDTNSTLGGALAAAKMHIPVAHVEAGLRSHNRRMPEEINRVMTDHLSSLLLCPIAQAVSNLSAEGITQGVHFVGDVMYDAAFFFVSRAQSAVDPLAAFSMQSKKFVLMTCHRAENTDDPARLSAILQAANDVAHQMPVLFPVHPRTRSRLTSCKIELHPQLKLVEPVSYLEMLMLERHAALVLTDSGGVQKEAFFFGVRCVTMRDETEWIETAETGANAIAGAETASISQAVNAQLSRSEPVPDASPWYGGGRAAKMTADFVAELAQHGTSRRKSA